MLAAFAASVYPEGEETLATPFASPSRALSVTGGLVRSLESANVAR